MAATTLDVVKLSPHIGAEILGVDLTRPLDAATKAALKRAWLDNIVLVFRGLSLEQQDFLNTAGIFGAVAPMARPKEEYPIGYADLLPNIMLISNIRKDGVPIGALPDGEMMFHHDMIHSQHPHKGTLLYSREVPSVGGNTLFASGYAAYETLPRDVRDRLEGRTARHFYNYGSTQKGDGRGTKASAASEHPVFAVNPETGRKAVYANRLMTEEISGLEKDEFDRLLAFLFDHAEKPDFVYEHVWQVGDLILWDNRCSMHARTDFPDGERRLMWRVTLEGEDIPR